MSVRPFPARALAGVVTAAFAFSQVPSSTAAEPSSRVVMASEVEWEQLNPARGDKSPRAATLWGDRTGAGPAGFLLKPADGFRSPPHIHNVAYRGVVISGLLHNDDPDAADMWMPAGSFWTQPAGEVHITAAKGNDALAYIEVEDSFGVFPAKSAFDGGEKPVNVDASNIVWLDASNTVWIDQPGTPASGSGPKVAFLWGNPQDGRLNGTLVKLPAGSTGTIRSHGSTLRAVAIRGRPVHQGAGTKTLDPGSYFSSRGEAKHRLSCGAGEDCVIYVRAIGKFDVIPGQPKT